MAEEVASPLLALLQDPQRAPLIKQGAEAKVYRVELYTISSSITLPDAVSTKQEDYAYPILLKHRFFKKYRHPMLSASITATRTVSEARSLVRCARSGVHVPRLELVDETRGIIGMEWIHGVSVRRLLGGIPEESDCEDITLLSTTPALTEERAQEVMDKIGVQLAEMHCADVIHGDLTTSNMMLRDLDTSIVLIDFGLAG
ncbi:Bud32p [Malassezia vespertilionis]|uniref:non-specific serine/threonine protein kinase n=1 Tax=Malassezia vespertilionis TaxID=2020962 RepID=A0A2N1JCJ5_9BASI|nr:Bud32p [Malassezia vespertilionis]